MYAKYLFYIQFLYFLDMLEKTYCQLQYMKKKRIPILLFLKLGGQSSSLF